jgi:hypothetical protein
MVAFVTYMLISENVTIDLDLVSEIVFLVVDFWIIGFVLRGKVWRQDPYQSVLLGSQGAGKLSPMGHIIKALLGDLAFVNGLEQSLAVLEDQLPT